MCALRAKFAAHPAIRKTLLDTGSATLIEHTEKDRYWGDGGDGTGKNRLGVLLMRLRDELNHGASDGNSDATTEVSSGSKHGASEPLSVPLRIPAMKQLQQDDDHEQNSTRRAATTPQKRPRTDMASDDADERDTNLTAVKRAKDADVLWTPSGRVPHSRCNWVIPSRLLVGAEPTADTLPAILSFGVTKFICLSDCHYESSLPFNVALIKAHMRHGAAGTQKAVELLANQVVDDMHKTSARIYMHCRGGHGRAGMLGAIIAGLYYGLKCVRAIAYIEEKRNERPDKSHNFIPTPETTAQVKMVAAIIQLEDNAQLPDRSSRLWLKRVQKERKERAANKLT